MPAKMTGLDEMKARLTQAATSAHAQLRTAVETEANRLLEEAKARVPVESGTLRDSGTVTMTETGTKVTATIAFDTPYATYIHEDLELQHEHGGQAKYLESVLNEEVGNVADNLAEKIDLGKM